MKWQKTKTKSGRVIYKACGGLIQIHEMSPGEFEMHFSWFSGRQIKFGGKYDGPFALHNAKYCANKFVAALKCSKEFKK